MRTRLVPFRNRLDGCLFSYTLLYISSINNANRKPLREGDDLFACEFNIAVISKHASHMLIVWEYEASNAKNICISKVLRHMYRFLF